MGKKMFDADDMIAVMETAKDVHDALSVSVKISRAEVDGLIVSELMKLFIAHEHDGQGDKFKAVLLFYLTGDEFENMLWNQAKR